MSPWWLLSAAAALALGYAVGDRVGEGRGQATPGTLASAVRALLARGAVLGFPLQAGGGAAEASAARAGASLPRDADGLTRELQRFSYWVEDQWRRSEEERRRLTVVLGGMAEGVLLLDRYGRVLLCNDVASGLWPNLAPRLQGRNQIELFQDAELDRALTRALFQGEPQEVELVRPDAPPGPRRTWRVRIQPLDPAQSPSVGIAGAVPADAPSGAVVVVEDVTERRDVDRMRRDFVANVSHELQTPLTSIRGYAETLQDVDLDADERRRFLARILEHTRRMAALVQDLLSLAQMEAPRPAPAELVPLAELVADAVGEYVPEAERAGVALSLDVDARARGALVRGRPHELRLAVVNLVRNGLAYTPPGGRVGVSLTLEEAAGGEAGEGAAAGGAPGGERPARRAPPAAGGDPVLVGSGRLPLRPERGPRAAAEPNVPGISRSWLVLQVADTGVGIPAEALPRVFERFYRVDQGRARATGGTGLGLAIVKHAVAGHGGTVEVRSELGKGSTFSVWLPVDPPRG
jgi:two-component system phosphate regulon sensor histidine kinase PhoR